MGALILNKRFVRRCRRRAILVWWLRSVKLKRAAFSFVSDECELGSMFPKTNATLLALTEGRWDRNRRSSYVVQSRTEKNDASPGYQCEPDKEYFHDGMLPK